MKRRTSTTALWDFCQLFLSTFATTIFPKVQSLLASCDATIFCIIGFIFTYIVIMAIKIVYESEHRQKSNRKRPA